MTAVAEPLLAARDGVVDAGTVCLVILDARGTDRHRWSALVSSVAPDRPLVIAVDHMDRVGNEYEPFKWVREAFVAQAGRARPELAVPVHVVPVTMRTGDNVGRRSRDIDWYDGPTLLDALAITP